MGVVHKKNFRSVGIYYAFFVSGALNIIFLLGLIYYHYFSAPSYGYKEAPATSKKVVYTLMSPSIEAVLKEYKQMSFDQLVKEMERTEHVEQGFCRCDLALSSLVTFHQVDINRAAGGSRLETRTLLFKATESEKPITLTLYPGIKGESFARIRHFLAEEIYPFTTKGLFEKAQKQNLVDEALKQTLMMSHEFLSLHYSFARAREPVPKEVLFKMVTEGSWELFDRYSKQSQHELTGQLLGPVLKAYVQASSPMAAYLAILLEKEYVLKQFNDTQLKELLTLIEPKNLEVKSFLKDVMVSMRSDEIQQIAARKLHEAKGEGAIGVAFTKKQALQKEELQKPIEQDIREHAIKEGETLWGLSRLYGIDIDAIKEANDLSSSVLIPGKKLKIPYADKP